MGIKTSSEYDVLRSENKRLRGHLERAAAALNQIASWPQGEEVNGGFDEPASAGAARAALKGIPANYTNKPKEGKQ